MKFLLLAIAFLTACPSHAFEQAAFSPACPICTNLNITAATVQMERKDSTGKFTLIGTQLKLGLLNLIGTPPLLFELSAPKTSTGPVIPTHLRWTATLTGEDDLEPEVFTVHQRIVNPPTLPLGTKMGCRYDMPGKEISLVSLVDPLIALSKLGPLTTQNVNAVLHGKDLPLGPAPRSGWLRCDPGKAPTSIPAPIITVTPPVITPTTVSKPGDTVPHLTQLVASDGVWTLATGQVFRNGVNMGNPYSPNVINIYVAVDGRIRSTASSGVYSCWLGTGWGC